MVGPFEGYRARLTLLSADFFCCGKHLSDHTVHIRILCAVVNDACSEAKSVSQRRIRKIDSSALNYSLEDCEVEPVDFFSCNCRLHDNESTRH